MPGMYVVTSIPLVRRTRATLRRAEFGFLGVEVYTRTHTPRFWGQAISAGDLVRAFRASRPFRTSWLIVGTAPLPHVPGGTCADRIILSYDPRANSRSLADGLEQGQDAGRSRRLGGFPSRLLGSGGRGGGRAEHLREAIGVQVDLG